MVPNMRAYLESWSLELTSRSNRIRQLIGDAHWLSDGHHKEELLRDFLTRYLPKDLDILRGFVKPNMVGSKCSPEVDILITDPHRAIPYFQEGGVQIVHPDAVIAHLEVKSKFTADTIKEALLNIARTKRLTTLGNPTFEPWSGIIFYTIAASRTPDTIIETLINALNYANSDFKQRLADDQEVYKILEVPNCIAIEDKYVIFLDAVGGSKPLEQTIRIRLFEGESLCLACAIADLFGSISEYLPRGETDAFSGVAESITFANQTIKSIILK